MPDESKSPPVADPGPADSPGSAPADAAPRGSRRPPRGEMDRVGNPGNPNARALWPDRGQAQRAWAAELAARTPGVEGANIASVAEEIVKFVAGPDGGGSPTAMTGTA